MVKGRKLSFREDQKLSSTWTELKGLPKSTMQETCRRQFFSSFRTAKSEQTWFWTLHRLSTLHNHYIWIGTVVPFGLTATD